MIRDSDWFPYAGPDRRARAIQTSAAAVLACLMGLSACSGQSAAEALDEKDRREICDAAAGDVVVAPSHSRFVGVIGAGSMPVMLELLEVETCRLSAMEGPVVAVVESSDRSVVVGEGFSEELEPGRLWVWLTTREVGRADVLVTLRDGSSGDFIDEVMIPVIVRQARNDDFAGTTTT